MTPRSITGKSILFKEFPERFLWEWIAIETKYGKRDIAVEVFCQRWIGRTSLAHDFARRQDIFNMGQGKGLVGRRGLIVCTVINGAVYAGYTRCPVHQLKQHATILGDDHVRKNLIGMVREQGAANEFCAEAQREIAVKHGT